MFVFLASCVGHPKLTSTDESKMKLLQTEFGSRYSFVFEQDLYLKAQSLTADAPDKEEATRIYKIFWFNGDNRVRSDSNYVYLNIYNNQGQFLFQVSWDREKSKPIFSRAEHY
jgi:hypothetical protein